jgi:hypothetical protein
MSAAVPRKNFLTRRPSNRLRRKWLAPKIDPKAEARWPFQAVDGRSIANAEELIAYYREMDGWLLYIRAEHDRVRLQLGQEAVAGYHAGESVVLGPDEDSATIRWGLTYKTLREGRDELLDQLRVLMQHRFKDLFYADYRVSAPALRFFLEEDYSNEDLAEAKKLLQRAQLVQRSRTPNVRLTNPAKPAGTTFKKMQRVAEAEIRELELTLPGAKRASRVPLLLQASNFVGEANAAIDDRVVVTLKQVATGVSERALRDALNCSATTVSDALGRLSAEGKVEACQVIVKSGRGTRPAGGWRLRAASACRPVAP